MRIVHFESGNGKKYDIIYMEMIIMRLAIFSDIHGNYQATKAIMDDINKNDFNEIICLGDIIGIGPKPKECLELLLNSEISIIAGNHDLYYRDGIEIDKQITEENEIAHHHWIHDCIKNYISPAKMNFPLSKELDICGKKILFQHYMLNDEIKGNEYPFSRVSYLPTYQKVGLRGESYGVSIDLYPVVGCPDDDSEVERFFSKGKTGLRFS